MGKQSRFDVFWQEVFAGLTIFSAIAYVVIAVPVVLAGVGVPATAAMFGTCLLTGLATLACGLYARSPSAIAPAIGMLFLFKDFVVPNSETDTGHAWQSGLAVSMAVGLIFWLFSINLKRLLFGPDGAASSLSHPSTVREGVLFRLPGPVRASVIASIGSLLAASAFDMALGASKTFESYQYLNHWSDEGARLGIFTVAVAFIAFCDVLFRPRLRDVIARSGQTWRVWPARLFLLLAELAPLLSVIIIALIVKASVSLPASAELFAFATPEQRSQAWVAITQDNALAMVAFGLILLCVLLTDFAGAPYDILRHKDFIAHAGEDVPADQRERRIIRSLRVDSGMNLLAPFFAVSPLVYYAESWAGQYNRGRSGGTAIAAAIPFLILAGVIAYLSIEQGFTANTVLQAVPPLALAPVLFYVGLIITTASFSVSEDDTQLADTPTDDTRLEANFKPAAFSAIITGVTGNVSLGMLAGLLVYVLALGVRRKLAGVDARVYVLIFIVALANLLPLFFVGASEAA